MQMLVRLNTIICAHIKVFVNKFSVHTVNIFYFHDLLFTISDILSILRSIFYCVENEIINISAN